jgi:RNA polymerase sigma-70 factor (ECF subfamily)
VAALIDLLDSNEPAPESNLDATHQRQWIRDAVESLPEALRQAVNLVYYQGLKYREAADTLDIPVGTVKSRLHSAILKLNESWMASHPEDKD